MSITQHIEALDKNIIKVVYTTKGQGIAESLLISPDFKPKREDHSEYYELDEGKICFKNLKGEKVLEEVKHSLMAKDIYTYFVDGDPVMQTKLTANGEVTYIANAKREVVDQAYEGKITFKISPNEILYGLGQHEEGIYNYNGKKEYLYQNNMIISIPVLFSSNNYAIVIDSESAMVFESESGMMSFTLDTTRQLTYYVILGENLEAISKSLRRLTGTAPMLPRWAFGYVQSKERYSSQEELLEIAEEFRRRGIPIDCLVQDWYTWEDGLWGEKKVDQKRYPDVKGLVGKLHEEHIKLMISIWPNMTKSGENYKAFEQKEMLLPNAMVYDAYNEEARALYWKQCEEEWFNAGIDAWWCDNAEPFSDPDWNGETKRPQELRYNLILEESKKSMDWTRINSYGLLHAKGIYENWRKSSKDKRVVNLTRSSYLSGQRYGVIPWSGDITAKWSTLQKQVVEGIKMSMSGMPYWTLDIGAFFTVKDKWENRGCNCNTNTNPIWFWDGDYNEGVEDLGYRELYVRWLQYGTFLPMFRSHGTDTPREPWRFGEPGDMFYEAIIKFINLRYQLMPYIYSLAADVTYHQGTILRSLMFDFQEDEKVKTISDSYMFGKQLLVCPITEAMYYGPESTLIEDKAKVREVYLPEGVKWYDFWTNKVFEGGQHRVCSTPIDTIPLFVKAGAIIPLSAAMGYADARRGEVDEIVVYAGSDGTFTLYNDEGDNYSYETGNYSVIRLYYDDQQATLQFAKHEGGYPYQQHFTITLISEEGTKRKTVLTYEGEEVTIKL